MGNQDGTDRKPLTYSHPDLYTIVVNGEVKRVKDPVDAQRRLERARYSHPDSFMVPPKRG